MSVAKITAAALAACALAGCNTMQEDAGGAGQSGSTASGTSQQNDTTTQGGAVTSGQGASSVRAPGLSTGASGGPGTPTPNNSTPPPKQ